MAGSEAAASAGRLEFRLLVAAVAASASMVVVPAAIPVALGLLCWAAILLATRRPRNRRALIAAIAVVAVACVCVAVLGIATLTAMSTTTPGVTLIEEGPSD